MPENATILRYTLHTQNPYNEICGQNHIDASILNMYQGKVYILVS